MKKLLLLITAAAFICAGSSFASGKWTLQSKDYTVDTLFHAKIGPGTTQTSLHLSGSNNLKIFYITVDLTNPNVDVRVAQAGSRLTGGAKLSTMSNANTNETTGIQYFAGVNADFFGGSQPIGSTVVNSDVYKASNSSGWINWYMNDSKTPGIEQLSFTGIATGPTASHPVSAINDSRYTDYLVIYNPHYGATTGTNAYGSEVLISSDKSISFNGTYTCTVESAPATAGSMTIPAGKYVLSGHGTAAAFVNTLKAGDKVTLDLNTPLATGGTITQMAGGMPIILQNGETLNTQGALDHLTALNPRTAVGYTADRKTLVLLVVDGRGMGGSAGVVSKVLADIMREVGCSDAMNFDGGGSSELYTRAFGVRNVPSDGQERTVVNSVWAVSTAPADNTISELAFTAPSITLPKYGYYVPSFYAYNQYGLMLSTDFKGAALSCDPELGQIIDGTTLFATGSGTHKLTATYNGVTTQIDVTIGGAAPRPRLESVIVDSFRDYKAEVVAPVNGEDMSIDNKALTWSVDDANIATVDELGVIHGVANGTTTVTGTVEDNKMTLPVNVMIPAKRYIDIDSDSDVASTWTASKTGLSTATVSRSGKGLAVDYKISSTRGTQFIIKPVEPIELYSLPDSVRLVINPANGSATKLTAQIAPKGVRADAYKVSYDLSLTPNTENIVSIPVSDIIDTEDFANYPLTLTSLQFAISGKVGDEVHFDIPELRTVHAAVKDTEAVGNILSDHKQDNSLIDNNIVYRGTLIELHTDKPWAAYNINGALVATGTAPVLDTATLPKGAYILTSGNLSARLVVK